MPIYLGDNNITGGFTAEEKKQFNNSINLINEQMQTKTDKSLTTTSKEVVGAINELDTNKLDKPEVDGTAGQILVLQDDGSLAYADNVTAFDDAELRELIDTKVDKVEGKGLSTCDFTSVRASKLDRFHNYGKDILISNVMTVSYFSTTTIEPQSQVILVGSVVTYNTVLGTSYTSGDKRTTFMSGQYQGIPLSRSCFHFYNPTSINTNILWPICVTTYDNGLGAKITIKNISTTESVTIPGYAGNNKTAFAIMIDLPTNAIVTS